MYTRPHLVQPDTGRSLDGHIVLARSDQNGRKGSKMKTLEERIIDELKNEGIEAEKIEIVKNGVPCKGIRICTADTAVCPIVYYSEHETVETFMARVRDVLEKDTAPLGVERLTDWSYVRDHAYLSLQKRGTEDIVKKPYLNLELILRIFLDLGDEAGSVKATGGLIDQLGVTEEEIWQAAEANTRCHITVRSMAEVLGLGTEDEDQLYVVTAGMYGGASALFYPEVFRMYCEEHGEAEAYILPSSVDEILVLPGSNVGRIITLDELARMVQTINEGQVAPIMRLPAEVFVYDLVSDSIGIAAVADGEVI